MAIKAIIFDIDGVLADSRQAVVENTKQLLAEFGFSAKHSEVEKMSSAHSAESVLIALLPQLKNEDALLRRMLARLSKITVANLHLVKPTPLAALLPDLKRKYLLAAASNRKSSAMMVLEKLGIEKEFAVVMTSSDAPPKPDPKMILLALERLNVNADEAVFVGDNDEDVEAGRRAGVRTIKIDGTDEDECLLFLSDFLPAC